MAVPRLPPCPGTVRDHGSHRCFQTTASCRPGVGRSADPTISRASLIQIACDFTAQSAKVLHSAIPPKECMGNKVPGKSGLADDLAAIVDALCLACCSSEISEFIVPLSHRNGSWVGTPELHFGLKLAKDFQTSRQDADCRSQDRGRCLGHLACQYLQAGHVPRETIRICVVLGKKIQQKDLARRCSRSPPPAQHC